MCHAMANTAYSRPAGSQGALCMSTFRVSIWLASKELRLSYPIGEPEGVTYEGGLYRPHIAPLTLNEPCEPSMKVPKP